MAVRQICPGIVSVGAIDWDRRLFDELIPLPDGTSYNSYLVQGSEKTALLDTVDPIKVHELLANLASLGIGTIDYVVAHHAEQDHAGAIPDILAAYPAAKVICNDKCKGMLSDHLHVPEDRFQLIQDNDTLPLGGKTLRFIMAPWVHWPETFLTYLAEDRILFPCDFFGSHLAQSELFVGDECRTFDAAKRYYAEIMMPFRSHIAKHLERLKEFDIKWIAPSHGPVYQNPSFILDAYRNWVSDTVANRVLIPFVSMHGSTRLMVEHLTDALIRRGVSVVPCNITNADIGELAEELVDVATVVIGSPTVLTGAHPEVGRVAYLANALRPKFKFTGLIGSYGWGGRMAEQILQLFTAIKPEVLPPVIVKGMPREDDFRSLDQLAETIRQKHESIGIWPAESA